MPRRKPLDPNKLRPRSRDLFRQVVVTLKDLDDWCNEFVPHLCHSRHRMDFYIQGYNVAEKVKQAILSGFWPH